MAKVHLVLQGKGGVGKSLVSYLISQYLQSRGDSINCIDTDPVNATLSSYQAFPVRRIELMEGSEINARKFDAMMEIILNNTDSEIVIDNGASAFIPLSSYLLESRAIEMAEEHGHNVIIHTIVTGGQAFQDTATGFNSLIKQFHKSVDFIIWLNEYFGKIERDGKTFQEMKLFQKHEERIKKVITIPKQSELFEQDMQEML